MTYIVKFLQYIGVAGMWKSKKFLKAVTAY